jgi:hypothetical protein
VAAEVFRFLAIDSSVELSEIGQVYNPTPETVRRTRRLLHQIRWSSWWTRIAPVVPQNLKAFARRHEYTSQKKTHYLSSRTRARLEAVFAEENERLFALIGHRFDEWRIA